MLGSINLMDKLAEPLRLLGLPIKETQKEKEQREAYGLKFEHVDCLGRGGFFGFLFWAIFQLDHQDYDQKEVRKSILALDEEEQRCLRGGGLFSEFFFVRLNHLVEDVNGVNPDVSEDSSKLTEEDLKCLSRFRLPLFSKRSNPSTEESCEVLKLNWRERRHLRGGLLSALFSL